MSLENDEKLVDIKDNVKQSCKYLSEILYDDIYGYDSFSEEYRNKLKKSLNKLDDVRKLLDWMEREVNWIKNWVNI